MQNWGQTGLQAGLIPRGAAWGWDSLGVQTRSQEEPDMTGRGRQERNGSCATFPVQGVVCRWWLRGGRRESHLLSTYCVPCSLAFTTNLWGGWVDEGSEIESNKMGNLLAYTFTLIYSYLVLIQTGLSWLSKLHIKFMNIDTGRIACIEQMINSRENFKEAKSTLWRKWRTTKTWQKLKGICPLLEETHTG